MLKIKLSKPISISSLEELEQIVRDEFETLISQNRTDAKDMVNLFKLLALIDEILIDIDWRNKIQSFEFPIAQGDVQHNDR